MHWAEVGGDGVEDLVCPVILCLSPRVLHLGETATDGVQGGDRGIHDRGPDSEAGFRGEVLELARDGDRSSPKGGDNSTWGDTRHTWIRRPESPGNGVGPLIDQTELEGFALGQFPLAREDSNQGDGRGSLLFWLRHLTALDFCRW